MSVVTESFRVQDDPRVVELTGKLAEVQPAVARIRSDLAAARERLGIAVGEADLAEALAEIGEGSPSAAKRARAAAVDVEGEVALLEGEAARKAALQDALSKRLVEAEEAAAESIRARLRSLMSGKIAELDSAIQEAMRVNAEVAELEIEGRSVLRGSDGVLYPFFSWDALRADEHAYDHSTKSRVPRFFFQGGSDFGSTAYRDWRRLLEKHGFGPGDE